MSLSEDYALISRVVDPTTGQLVVTAAGIMAYGTRAAGEFLTDPAYMEQAVKLAPGDWSHKNIQIVVSTKIVGRKQRAAASRKQHTCGERGENVRAPARQNGAINALLQRFFEGISTRSSSAEVDFVPAFDRPGDAEDQDA